MVAVVTADHRLEALELNSLRLFGVPMRWRTRIDEWTPETRFVDVQLSGPYRSWHHTHTLEDTVDTMSGLVCAVYIVLSANIVTGIMLGFCTLVIGRIVAGEWRKLNVGTVAIAVVLAVFYLGGWAI